MLSVKLLNAVKGDQFWRIFASYVGDCLHWPGFFTTEQNQPELWELRTFFTEKLFINFDITMDNFFHGKVNIYIV
jgi:hypothetical protein